jgi:hypothetical protein
VPQTDAPSSGLSSGALIGIVSGSAVVLALIVGVGIFLVRHRAPDADDGLGMEPEYSPAAKSAVEDGADVSSDAPEKVDIQGSLAQYGADEMGDIDVESEDHSQDLYL